jgi:ketol-acid reductoisomerase
MSAASGHSPSYRTTSKTICLPSSAMARRAMDRASTRDTGLNIVVGSRPPCQYADTLISSLLCGLFRLKVPGETLFPIEEAIKRGTIIMNPLSDAAQSGTWSRLVPLITKARLYFLHGFSVVYRDREDTKVVAPKGRRHHLCHCQGLWPRRLHALQRGLAW